jgi:hypothetical protein
MLWRRGGGVPAPLSILHLRTGGLEGVACKALLTVSVVPRAAINSLVVVVWAWVKRWRPRSALVKSYAAQMKKSEG